VAVRAVFLRDPAAGVLRFACAWSVPDPAVEAYVDASRDIGLSPRRGAGWSGLADGRARLGGGCPGQQAGRNTARFRSPSAYAACSCSRPRRNRVDRRVQVQQHGASRTRRALIQASRAIGNLVGLFLQRRRAERDLIELNAELEQRVAERTTELQNSVKEMEAFTYTVAHDLRSPLRAMNGYCEILLEDYGKTIPEEGRSYLSGCEERRPAR